jgi:hypothetical protein
MENSVSKRFFRLSVRVKNRSNFQPTRSAFDRMLAQKRLGGFPVVQEFGPARGAVDSFFLHAKSSGILPAKFNNIPGPFYFSFDFFVAPFRVGVLRFDVVFLAVDDREAVMSVSGSG